MTAEELDQTIGEIGICACHYPGSVWILRELLEIAEDRLWEDANEKWLDTRLRAAVNDIHARGFILGVLGSHDLIEHEDGELELFYLTERGGEVLGAMRDREENEPEGLGLSEKELN